MTYRLARQKIEQAGAEQWEELNRSIVPLVRTKSSQYDKTMTRKQKLLRKILGGTQNIAFSDMVTLSEAFGFRLSRISGSHHIFEHPSVPEPLNLQNKNGQAKSYQVRQFLQLIEQYNLTLDKGEE
jgi:HicA toxin of bacterial toxin-antitoxin,